MGDVTNEPDVSENVENIQEEVQELCVCEHAHPVGSVYISTKIRNAGEWIASLSWGQVLFKYVDTWLWCIERTLLWQNPSDKFAPMGPPVNMVVGYHFAAFLWLLQPVFFIYGLDPVKMIRWVQTRRRRLRAIRFLGMKNIRRENKLKRPSIFLKIFRLFGVMPNKTEVKNGFEHDTGNEVGTEDPKTSDYQETDLDHNKKRRYSDISSTTDEGAVLSLDDEYNSDSDSDYLPDEYHSSESSDSEDLTSVDEEEDIPEENTLEDSTTQGETEHSDKTDKQSNELSEKTGKQSDELSEKTGKQSNELSEKTNKQNIELHAK